MAVNNIEKSISATKISLYDLFYASKTQKTYTNLGIALLLIILFLVFVLVPTIQKLDEIKERISVYEALNADVRQKIQTAQVLDRQINNTSLDNPPGLKEEIEFARKSFLSTKSLDVLLLNLYERSKRNSIEIINFVPKTPDELDQQENIPFSPSYTYFEVNLAAQAKNYDDIINFVNSLEGYENMPIASRIKSLDITDINTLSQLSSDQEDTQQNPNSQSEPSSQTNPPARFTLNITLVIYTLKD